MKQILIAGPTPDAWSADALYAKALLYVEKMGSSDSGSWEHALWSGLTLELLARAALSNISPTLLTDQKNWNNLLHSLGHPPTESKYSPRSIAIAEVLTRLRQILPKFDKEIEAFCIAHTGRRNAELHSGETPYNGVPGSSWHPHFYKSCIALLDSMGVDLKDFVGDEEADTALKVIAASLDEAAKAVESEVAAHRKVWLNKDGEEQAHLESAALSWATKELGHRVKCPACQSPALVTGDAISAPSVTLSEDEITETQEFLPNWFQCVACGLKITGLSKLNVVGLGDRYKNTKTFEAAAYYNPEDEYDYYEPDNNEPL